MPYEVAEKVLLYGVMVLCALSDLSTGKIFNQITYPAAALGLVLAVVAGGLPELGQHGLGLAVGFVPFFLVFLFGGMGGGDVKLMGAAGAIVGYPAIVAGLFHTILVGGVLAVSVMLWKGVLWRGIRNTLWTVVTWAMPMQTQKLDPANSQRVPFGVAIAVGTIWASLENLDLLRHMDLF
jgi:prepilin peptidase CpaA